MQIHNGSELAIITYTTIYIRFANGLTGRGGSKNMKVCRICKKEIINGQNGCVFQGNICNDCNGGAPIYYAKARQAEQNSDYEGLILARQEGNL